MAHVGFVPLGQSDSLSFLFRLHHYGMSINVLPPSPPKKRKLVFKVLNPLNQLVYKPINSFEISTISLSEIPVMFYQRWLCLPEPPCMARHSRGLGRGFGLFQCLGGEVLGVTLATYRFWMALVPEIIMNSPEWWHFPIFFSRFGPCPIEGLNGLQKTSPVRVVNSRQEHDNILV